MNSYQETLSILRRRFAEQAPGRVQLLTGPRQIGKTTLMLELQKEWGERAVYVAADAAEAALPGWWELQWQRATRAAQVTPPALLLVDEVQYLPDWSRRLKSEHDRLRREGTPLHVMVTGSAALTLGAGSRETMAGRFEKLSISHWSAADLSAAFGLAAEEATRMVVRFGGFPGAVPLLGDVPRWQAYVRDSIIDPAIGRDLLAFEAVRKPALLRQLFAVSAGHPAEIISLQKIAGLLAEPGSLTTIAHYLELLAEAYLVAGLQKHSKTAVRQRASPPKLVPLSNAFVTASGSFAEDAQRRGRLVENACLAFSINRGQTVHYWREEPYEVDAIVEGSWGKWAVEIKTSTFAARDLVGLLEFVRRNRSFQPLVVCDEAHCRVARQAGVAAVSWQQFLWEGVPDG